MGRFELNVTTLPGSERVVIEVHDREAAATDFQRLELTQGTAIALVSVLRSLNVDD